MSESMCDTIFQMLSVPVLWDGYCFQFLFSLHAASRQLTRPFLARVKCTRSKFDFINFSAFWILADIFPLWFISCRNIASAQKGKLTFLNGYEIHMQWLNDMNTHKLAAHPKNLVRHLFYNYTIHSFFIYIQPLWK